MPDFTVARRPLLRLRATRSLTPWLRVRRECVSACVERHIACLSAPPGGVVAGVALWWGSYMWA